MVASAEQDNPILGFSGQAPLTPGTPAATAVDLCQDEDASTHVVRVRPQRGDAFLYMAVGTDDGLPLTRMWHTDCAVTGGHQLTLIKYKEHMASEAELARKGRQEKRKEREQKRLEAEYEKEYEAAVKRQQAQCSAKGQSPQEEPGYLGGAWAAVQHGLTWEGMQDNLQPFFTALF